MARRTLRTAIEIDASPRAVWDVIADFAAYPEWNPFIRHLAGEARPGARLEVQITPPGGRAMTFRPTVLRADPERELRWLGHLLVRGLFDGEHSLRIQRLSDRTRFIQEERFGGLLVGAFGGALDRTRQGFGEMNQALKERVEAIAAASGGR